MPINRFIIVAAILHGQVASFSLGRAALVRSSSSSASVLFATSLVPEAENNPATKFGSPLSESMKGVNKAGVDFIKSNFIDVFFSGEDRAYARFYALETIARVPYFSYLSVLHLYETLGKWRRAKYLKLHFAESWNEMHHLLIMEELGGNIHFFDRFVAQHIAFFYYAIVAFLYLLNPVEAYNLNEGVEEHAYSTYDTYLKENEDTLKKLSAPKAAIDYYINGDFWLFDEFQTDCKLRRPKIENLYDVFVAIRDDELAHVNTMKMLQTELDVSSMRDGECDVD